MGVKYPMTLGQFWSCETLPRYTAIPACKLHGYSLHQNLEEKLICWGQSNSLQYWTKLMIIISHLWYRKEKKQQLWNTLPKIIHAWGNHTLNRYLLGLRRLLARHQQPYPRLHTVRDSLLSQTSDYLSPSREEGEKWCTPHRPQLSVVSPAYCRRVKDASTAAVAVGG